MEYKFAFVFCLIVFLTGGCVNNKKQHIDKIIHSDSDQANHVRQKNQYVVKPVTKTDKIENDSLNNYDVYKFTNDTLAQEVYVSYITAKQIKFLVRVKNKISLNTCEYSGKAMMANDEGTAQGNDESNDDELYGVFEYFTQGHPFFTIDIEFKRGKRMTIFTKDDKIFCKPDCPLSSQGTLRRVSLSKVAQLNPTW